MNSFGTIGQVMDSCGNLADGKIVKSVKVSKADMSKGVVTMEPTLDGKLYYKVIEELMNADVEDDRQLFILLKEYSKAKMAYDNIKGALGQAEASDYGIVAPKLSEMILEKPEVFKQGNKYGVRMKAESSLSSYNKDEYLYRSLSCSRNRKSVYRSGPVSYRTV